jgi:hypothetical protein
VLTHLLEEIEEEYEEAIQDGKVVNLPEYQDAFGFLQRARVQLEPLAIHLQDADQQQAKRVWKLLDDAIPSIMPPAAPVSAEAIEGHIKALMKILKGI